VWVGWRTFVAELRVFLHGEGCARGRCVWSGPRYSCHSSLGRDIASEGTRFMLGLAPVCLLPVHEQQSGAGPVYVKLG
jgi:hypothetical protein